MVMSGAFGERNARLRDVRKSTPVRASRVEKLTLARGCETARYRQAATSTSRANLFHYIVGLAYLPPSVAVP
jgi:hypothetical protein